MFPVRERLLGSRKEFPTGKPRTHRLHDQFRQSATQEVCRVGQWREAARA